MFLQPEEGLRQEVMFSVRNHKGWGSKCQGGHEEALATPVTDHNTETGSWKLRFKGTEGVTGFFSQHEACRKHEQEGTGQGRGVLKQFWSWLLVPAEE